MGKYLWYLENSSLRPTTREEIKREGEKKIIRDSQKKLRNQKIKYCQERNVSALYASDNCKVCCICGNYLLVNLDAHYSLKTKGKRSKFIHKDCFNENIKNEYDYIEL